MLNKEKPNTQSLESPLLDQLKKVSGVKFSKHAIKRLLLSDNELSSTDLERLRLGLEKAAGKNSQMSLIIVNNIAYIVSIKNSTVITVFSDYSTKKRVVNEIDSIVFM